MANALVTTEWLASQIGNKNMVLIDASFFPPGSLRDAKNEYREKHIPGTVFFDIDSIADTSTNLPHMLPSPELFAEKVGAMGIGNDSIVVAYDSQGIFSAPRVWWMLRIMGHHNVYVLDGGLVKWLAEGRAVTSDVSSSTPQKFVAHFNPELVRSLDQVKNRQTTQLIDARGPGRFCGTEPETWPGRRQGHIPGAKNVPFAGLINADKTMLLPDKLREKFAEIDLEKPIIANCGSGVSACVLALALFQLGRNDIAVYDGSWAEWGLEASNQPVELGSLS